MLTAGDVLPNTLAKSQKITFWSQKNSFRCFFFLLTAGNALTTHIYGYSRRYFPPNHLLSNRVR